MIRPDPTSKRAMIDALRHMARAGYRPVDLIRLADGKRHHAAVRAVRGIKTSAEARK